MNQQHQVHKLLLILPLVTKDIKTLYSNRTYKTYKFRMRALNSINQADKSTLPGTVTSYSITFT
jgi:hypothetical protein